MPRRRSKRKRPEPDPAERERLVAAINRVVEREGSAIDPFWIALQATAFKDDDGWSDE
jgi:hypothetical protein